MINNLIDFHELIFTLFVFNIYFRIIKLNASFLTIFQQSTTIKKTIIKIKLINAICQINNAFNFRNKSWMIAIYNLCINLFVLMFRKNKSNWIDNWIDFFTFFDLNEKMAFIESIFEFVKFWLTTIKFYNSFTNDDLKKLFFRTKKRKFVFLKKIMICFSMKKKTFTSNWIIKKTY